MKKNFKIEGMSCTACAAAIERTVNKMDGVEDAVVNYATENLSVTYDDSSVHAPAIVSAIEKIGYGAVPEQDASPSGKSTVKNTAGENAQKQMKELQTRLIISLIFTIPLFYLSMGPMIGLPVPAFLDGDMNRLVNTITQMLLTLPVVYMGAHFY